MQVRLGVLVAVLSCALGAGGAVATSYLVRDGDAVTVAAIRFGGGFLCLLPIALIIRPDWPQRRDWIPVTILGFLFYGVAVVFYNLALSYTTVSRGTLALSTLPLVTMVLAALFGVERMSFAKSAGAAIAVGGVALSLASGLTTAPVGAWRGDLTMGVATLCMAFYSIYGRRYVMRSSALGVLTVGMGAGGMAMVALAAVMGGAVWPEKLTVVDTMAALYLAAGGGALAFVLWIWALQLASPTQVTAAMTLNPFFATLLAAGILSEPITPQFVLGLIAVFTGLLIAARSDG